MMTSGYVIREVLDELVNRHLRAVPAALIVGTFARRSGFLAAKQNLWVSVKVKMYVCGKLPSKGPPSAQEPL